MFNLIKMDIHRLFYSKSTWVIFFFVAVLSVFSVTMTNTDIHMMKEEPSATEETMDERQIGISVEADSEWVDGVLPSYDEGNWKYYKRGDAKCAACNSLCDFYSFVYQRRAEKRVY